MGPGAHPLLTVNTAIGPNLAKTIAKAKRPFAPFQYLAHYPAEQPGWGWFGCMSSFRGSVDPFLLLMSEQDAASTILSESRGSTNQILDLQ